MELSDMWTDNNINGKITQNLLVCCAHVSFYCVFNRTISQDKSTENSTNHRSWKNPGAIMGYLAELYPGMNILRTWEKWSAPSNKPKYQSRRREASVLASRCHWTWHLTMWMDCLPNLQAADGFSATSNAFPPTTYQRFLPSGPDSRGHIGENTLIVSLLPTSVE